MTGADALNPNDALRIFRPRSVRGIAASQLNSQFMKMVKKGDLTENERQLFQAITDVDATRFQALISENDVRANCLDEHGTSLLQQAAFKGSVSQCETLLARGADVNSNDHEHGYTALMFAALSGNANLCKVLLEAGAKAYPTNRVGRTASEMAAFTGQHHCVSVINNFISQDDIEQLIKPRGSDAEPRLPIRLAPALHQLSRTYNIHPVKTLLFLADNTDLCAHEKGVLFVMDQLFERQMKQKETNEVMALKLYIILNTLREVFKFMGKQKQTNKSKTDREIILLYAKHLLNAPTNCNFAENLERLMRESIRKFPYHHCILFQTVVKTISKINYGAEPHATTVIHQALLGHRMIMDETFCGTCGQSKAQKRCASCKSINYCSAECQKLHWFTHKKWCAQMAKEFGENERKKQEFYSPPDDFGCPGATQGASNDQNNGDTAVNVDDIQLEVQK